jgi:hypothetical protein
MMRLTPSKLDNAARRYAHNGTKPHGVGNTSIVYLFKDRAEVLTTELAKCEWLEHLGIIDGYVLAGGATYRGFQTGCYDKRYVTNCVEVYRYVAPLWDQPTGRQLTEARRLTKKIRALMPSSFWSITHGVFQADYWRALQSADIHPDVTAAAAFALKRVDLLVDSGLNDWAVINGALRWIDPFHDDRLSRDTLRLRKP